ncbi:MAG: PspC domain-containing protein [Bacteroidia bacterium]|nr:PspC domain-containing protein [Bacteroidia bacterium]MDW8158196.1 PspC domain-containing protein [Bacteroidia bacterium]
MIEELQDFWKYQEDSKKIEHKKREAEELIRYNEELLAQDKKRQAQAPGAFMSFGIVFLVMAFFLIFTSSNFEFTPILCTLAIVLLVLGGLYTLNQVSYVPLRELSQKIDKLYQRWIQENSRNRKNQKNPLVRNLLLEKRSDRVLLGVAARLADKLGLDVALVRLVLVILLLITGGIIVALYIITGIILNFIDKQQKQSRLED